MNIKTFYIASYLSPLLLPLFLFSALMLVDIIFDNHDVTPNWIESVVSAGLTGFIFTFIPYLLFYLPLSLLALKRLNNKSMIIYYWVSPLIFSVTAVIFLIIKGVASPKDYGLAIFAPMLFIYPYFILFGLLKRFMVKTQIPNA